MTVDAEERLQWKADSANVNAFVDQMVTSLRTKEDIQPVTYMAVDMIFRSYLQWIHSAQILRADPELARDAAINSINIIIMELANRIRGVDEKGVKVNLAEWVGELMQDLAATLAEDCKRLEPAKKIIIPH